MHNIVSYIKKEDLLICQFDGRLDSVVSEIIEDDLLNHVLDASCATVFDFKNVDYVSSAFLRICVKAARITPSMKVDIINASPEIKEVYEMTGLERIFEFK